MKSLNLHRPLIIMMVGTPGAGKSYFARQFSELFSAPLISFDEIRHTLFHEPQYSADEEKLIALMMRQQINQLFKTERTFLIDGGLNTRSARMAIERLARAHDYGTIAVWVQTDEDTAAYRSTRRSAKRPGDALNKPMPEDVFTSQVKRINPPIEKEAHVVISGKHIFATQVKAVLKKILVPRPSQPQPEPPRRAASAVSARGVGRS